MKRAFGFFSGFVIPKTHSFHTTQSNKVETTVGRPDGRDASKMKNDSSSWGWEHFSGARNMQNGHPRQAAQKPVIRKDKSTSSPPINP